MYVSFNGVLEPESFSLLSIPHAQLAVADPSTSGVRSPEGLRRRADSGPREGMGHMYIYIFIYLIIFLSFYLSICLSTYLSSYAPIYPFIYGFGFFRVFGLWSSCFVLGVQGLMGWSVVDGVIKSAGSPNKK